MAEKANVSMEQVQKLRALSGAGVLECKNALVETGCDMDKAIQVLREKGMAKALKKATREAKNGLISAYIHQGDRIGVLLEVNCETDFVARTQEFKELVKEIGLQVAATNPQWLCREEVPQAVLDKEKDIFRKQMELQQAGKPPHVVEKIVQGKLEKFYSENCLLEQPYIRDPQSKMRIQDLVTAAVAKIGENISVKRFVRFGLGEN